MSRLIEKTVDWRGHDIIVGDPVLDRLTGAGFVVQEIRDDGWVWGGGMLKPYMLNLSKLFISNKQVEKLY